MLILTWRCNSSITVQYVNSDHSLNTDDFILRMTIAVKTLLESRRTIHRITDVMQIYVDSHRHSAVLSYRLFVLSVAKVSHSTQSIEHQGSYVALSMLLSSPLYISMVEQEKTVKPRSQAALPTSRIPVKEANNVCAMHEEDRWKQLRKVTYLQDMQLLLVAQLRV